MVNILNQYEPKLRTDKIREGESGSREENFGSQVQ